MVLFLIPIILWLFTLSGELTGDVAEFLNRAKSVLLLMPYMGIVQVLSGINWSMVVLSSPALRCVAYSFPRILNGLPRIPLGSSWVAIDCARTVSVIAYPAVTPTKCNRSEIDFYGFRWAWEFSQCWRRRLRDDSLDPRVTGIVLYCGLHYSKSK